ncbi:MAG: 16S rRNA (uracil(1498)-N(3))-methyltransferase [Sedimentisphaerales bacterium]|nr:16S rRNA (uracil(1498)-N(3))-methyltransferase [Sedimentisphaerales bacterium]
MQRFFINKDSISAGQVKITDPRVHQIRDVLRMKTGNEIIVLDNTGMEYHARLTGISQKEITGEIIDQNKCEAEPHTSITLYQSMLARDKFEVVLQKCTEVGVTCFVPVITERSIVRKPEKITKEKLSRFESIIAEAAEQSGRGIIPSIKSPVTMNQALAELDGYDICLFGSTLDCVSLKEILRSNASIPGKIALFIGPEGGFSDGELEEFSHRGVKAFSLGRRILRTETAGIVASSLILYELEQ